MIEHLQTVLMSCLMFFVLILRDVGFLASRRVVVPLLRDEQLAVDEDVFLSRNVSEKGADLSVVDLAEATEVLPCDTGGFFYFFFKSARIEGKDGIFFTDELDAPLTLRFGDAVEDDLVIPIGGADEQLQGSGFLAESVRDGFGIFSFQIGQESFDHRGGVRSGFGPVQLLEKGDQKAVESRSHSGEVFFVNLRILFNLPFSCSILGFHSSPLLEKPCFTSIQAV